MAFWRSTTIFQSARCGCARSDGIMRTSRLCGLRPDRALAGRGRLGTLLRIIRQASDGDWNVVRSLGDPCQVTGFLGPLYFQCFSIESALVSDRVMTHPTTDGQKTDPNYADRFRAGLDADWRQLEFPGRA